MRIAVKWRSMNRIRLILLRCRRRFDSARRKQTGGGLVEDPDQLALRRDDLRRELVGVARSFENILHRGRLALSRYQEHHALRIVDHRRREAEALGRLGTN